ncbi:MAG: P-loop NTPase [Planctomycetota bacterium]
MNPKDQNPADKSQAQILVVTSGKGGVGKTSLSVNVATELASRGLRIMLVDADLGLANAHILMGIKPTSSLTDYLENRAGLTDILSTGPSGLKLISGGQGVKEMANIDAEGRTRILDAIYDLRAYCDLVIIDTGAGVSKTVTDFVAIADQTLVVTNANFAAIANAYGIIKVMVLEGYSRPMHLLVNRVRSTEEANQVFQKLKECTEKFLSCNLNYLGLVPEDVRVNVSVQKRTPFTQAYPDTIASTYLKKIANGIEGLLQKGART